MAWSTGPDSALTTSILRSPDHEHIHTDMYTYIRYELFECSLSCRALNLCTSRNIAGCDAGTSADAELDGFLEAFWLTQSVNNRCGNRLGFKKVG